MMKKDEILVKLVSVSNEYIQMHTLLRDLYRQTQDQEDSLMIRENMATIEKALNGLREAMRATNKLNIK